MILDRAHSSKPSPGRENIIVTFQPSLNSRIKPPYFLISEPDVDRGIPKHASITTATRGSNVVRHKANEILRFTENKCCFYYIYNLCRQRVWLLNA
ncbi:unnamed protein product [Cylicocyclus nassatus]|uniref:Uncharacterized protein n=1 Tax=Cylicocyclus nassatus TaxID=53992 RepID=A0AA36H4Q2_CYLNA|nr:unnamed protein product [Cylicocyclus nassatus]